MIKQKNFLALCVFSLLCSMMGANEVEAAYSLTLKPKLHCEEGKLLIQGTCVDSSSIIPNGEEPNNDSGVSTAFLNGFRSSINSYRNMGIRGVYAVKRNPFKKWG